MVKVRSSVEYGVEVLGLLALLDASYWNQRVLCLHQVVLYGVILIASMFNGLFPKVQH